MSSTLVRHGCGVFASMDPSKMPDTYPSKPKQGQGAAAQQRYEELVEMFEGKFNIKDKWQLEAKSQLAYALLHEAVSKNPKLSGLIDKPELKDDFINSLAAIEAAIVDDADEAARELKEEILEKLKYGHTPDQIRDAIDFADCSNGHLRTVASGTYFIDDKALFDALKVSLKRMAELPRFNLLSTVYGLSKMDGSSVDNWEKTSKYVKAQVPLKTSATPSQPPVPSRVTALTAQQRLARQPFTIVCFKCGGPHRALGDPRRGLPACSVKCFCSICQEDTHSTEHHDMFKRIVGKPKAKETDGKPRYNKAMSATSATKSDNGKMYCLSAKCSDAQATEPGSCPLELLDSPEPEFTVTAHGDGSVGNSFIAIDFKNCYTNEPSNTTGQPFMTPGSRRSSAVSPGHIQPLILNLRMPSANEVASMEGTNDSILTSQVKSKLFRVGRMNPTHMNAPTKNINSMYEHQMSDAHKTVICKKGKLAKNNATRQLIRNKLVTSGLTIKGTVPMRDPGGKKCLHARAQFEGVNFSNVFDGTFSTSSSEAISDPNSKNGVSLGCLPWNRGSYSNGTCPMDASTTCNAQKGSLLGDPTHKIAPAGDSVGADEMILFNAEDMFDMQQTFNSYDFNEACNKATEEQFSKATVVAPDALTFLTPPTTTTPVLTGDSVVIRQNNPKRPGTASYLRYEMYKSASTKTEFHMLGGTSADLLWDRKKGYITVCDSADSMDTDNFADADGDLGGESDDGTGMTDDEFLAAITATNPP